MYKTDYPANVYNLLLKKILKMQHKHKKINNFTNITYHQENYNHQSKTNIKTQ